MGCVKRSIELGFASLYGLFLPWMAGAVRKVILYYHAVKSGQQSQFEIQAAYLADHYLCCSVSDLLNPAFAGTQNAVAITFDDAFCGLLQTALPVLQKYHIPATVFAPAGNLGLYPQWRLEEGCPDADEKVMNPDQLREVEKMGFEIQSHTMSHRMLTELDKQGILYELATSKRILEEILGHSISILSYPHGQYNTMICNLARQVGYQYGLTIVPRAVDKKTDPYQVGRFSVDPSEAIFSFRLKSAGAYQSCYYLQKLKQTVCTLSGSRQ